MINSETFYTLSRMIYGLKQDKANIKKRNVILRNLRVFVQRPGYISKRAIDHLARNRKKLYQVITGARVIENVENQKKIQVQNYTKWINKIERADYSRNEQLQTANMFAKKPLITLITPVYNPPAWALKELIDSVLNQTYTNFELILFDFSTNSQSKKIIEKYQKSDSRIIAKTELENGGISKNSNLCFKYAKGEYVGLLDHDDLLEVDVLYECVKVINEKDEPDFIYTDKDKITEEGIRFDPQLKPELSPELLLTANYLTHFDLMKKSMIEKVGGWDESTDGAQDWDLFLKITEITDKVVHIPKILYHWRTVKNSTANGIDVKPYVREAQLNVVDSALARRGLKTAKAYHESDGQLFISWASARHDFAIVLHGVYKAENIEKLIKNIIKQVPLSSHQPIYYYVLKNDLSKEYTQHLKNKFPGLRIISYQEGYLLTELGKLNDKLEKSIDKILYISDSIKNIGRGNINCINQLLGWLTIDEVGTASGRAVGASGQLIDSGGVYDKLSNRIIKIFLGKPTDYELIGYPQWTRNLIFPSQKVCAFKIELITDSLNKLGDKKLEIRDDEILQLIGLTAFNLGMRGVLDPQVEVVDQAVFSLEFSSSIGMKKLLQQTGLDKRGDPYLNETIEVGQRELNLPGSKNESLVKEEFIIQLLDI